jgi:hypothetical protein
MRRSAPRAHVATTDSPAARTDNERAHSNGDAGQPSINGQANWPDEWRRWIAERIFARMPAKQIIETLVHHGFDPRTAAAEVATVSAHPYVMAGERGAQQLQKLEEMLDVHHRVSSLSSGRRSVERQGPISRVEFLEWFYAANRPVILTGLMTGSRALANWTPDYLKQVCGGAMVEIMAGRSQDTEYEINCDRHKQSTRFGDYVDMVTHGGQSNDYYLVANNGFLDRPEARSLFDDLTMFPEYLDASKAAGQVFFWFGPGGTVTPLHHDVMNVLMTQVYGRKTVLLIAPDQTHRIYNHVGVYSEVDPEQPDYERFPRYRQVDVMRADLEPGDVLFLPVGWWHHVRSLSISITVSYINFAFPNTYDWS